MKEIPRASGGSEVDCSTRLDGKRSRGGNTESFDPGHRRDIRQRSNAATAVSFGDEMDDPVLRARQRESHL